VNLSLLVNQICAGYGVFAERAFKEGDFLLEYRGNLMKYSEALKLERSSQINGSWMYYFRYKDAKHW
jgi:SET domain-containing protein